VVCFSGGLDGRGDQKMRGRGWRLRSWFDFRDDNDKSCLMAVNLLRGVNLSVHSVSFEYLSAATLAAAPGPGARILCRCTSEA